MATDGMRQGPVQAVPELYFSKTLTRQRINPF